MTKNIESIKHDKNNLLEQEGGLFGEIRQLIEDARKRASISVNAEMTLLYWNVGKRINDEVLKGKRAEYGREIINALSKNLT